MIRELLSKRFSYLIILVFIVANSILIYFNFYYLLLLPILVITGFLYIFYLDFVFLIIVFCTPLSFNFENLDIGGVGFYFPTEPMLLAFTFIYIFKSILNPETKKQINYVKSPILLIIILQLLWIFITSITSEYPSVSFKFLLARS